MGQQINRHIIKLDSNEASSKKSTFKCKKCDHKWTATLYKVKRGTGCPMCSPTRKSTTVEFIERARVVHGDEFDYSEVVYTSSRHPVIVICNTHGRFHVTPNKHISARQKCPKCCSNTKLSNQEFDNKLLKASRGVSRLGDYQGAHVPLFVKCNVCNHQWTALPTKLHGKRATGCPVCRSKTGRYGKHVICDGIRFRSELERDCYQLLHQFCEEVGYTLELQKKYPQSNTNHTCDFYIPNVQLWIEVSGIVEGSYKNRIQKKAKWVDDIQESFLFVQSPQKLRGILYGKV